METTLNWKFYSEIGQHLEQPVPESYYGLVEQYFRDGRTPVAAAKDLRWAMDSAEAKAKSEAYRFKHSD